MKTKGWMALLSCLLVVACGSCSHNKRVAGPATDASAGVQAGGLYSRYSLHYYDQKGTNRASYANYTDCPGHAFLPYNTQFRVDSGRREGLTLTAVNTGMVIHFEFKSAEMGGMSAQEYINLIMSPTPVSYAGLTPEDEQGIKAGKAMVGMTKQGVMVALGYPAKSKTPSTDLNTWVFWKDRFRMLTVTFGENGKVGSLH
jgi:hypothetical protein